MIYESMKRTDPADISIARGRWLRAAPLVPTATSFELDPLLQETMPLWDALETECVVDCCGFDAFCFWPEAVQAALSTSAAAPIPALLRLRAAVADGGSDDVFGSDRLGAVLTRSTLLALLDIVVAGCARAIPHA